MEEGAASQHLGCFQGLGWMGLLGCNSQSHGVSRKKIQVALHPSVTRDNHPWPLLWGSLGDQAGSRVEGDL